MPTFLFILIVLCGLGLPGVSATDALAASGVDGRSSRQFSALPKEVQAYVGEVRQQCKEVFGDGASRSDWMPRNDMQGILRIRLDRWNAIIADNRELCADYIKGGNCTNRGCDVTIWREVRAGEWRTVFNDHLYSRTFKIDPKTSALEEMGIELQEQDARCRPEPDVISLARNSCHLIATYVDRKWSYRDPRDAPPNDPPAVAVVTAPVPGAAAPPSSAPATQAASSPPETRVALVIGNSDYSAVARLDNPERDAKAVAGALRAAGFNEVTEAFNLTSEGLRDALHSFAREADHADWAMIYFAGHGIEVGGVNYLIPVNAKLLSDRDLEFEAVPLGTVLAALAGARKLHLVVLDACRNNPFAAQMKVASATRSIGRGLARVEPDAGTLVVYAAKDGQVAQDGDGANSPFANALVRQLQTPGLEIRRMFDRVADDVMAQTKKAQQPFTYGRLSGWDSYFFVAPQ